MISSISPTLKYSQSDFSLTHFLTSKQSLWSYSWIFYPLSDNHISGLTSLDQTCREEQNPEQIGRIQPTLYSPWIYRICVKHHFLWHHQATTLIDRHAKRKRNKLYSDVVVQHKSMINRSTQSCVIINQVSTWLCHDTSRIVSKRHKQCLHRFILPLTLDPPITLSRKVKGVMPTMPMKSPEVDQVHVLQSDWQPY